MGKKGEVGNRQAQGKGSTDYRRETPKPSGRGDGGSARFYCGERGPTFGVSTPKKRASQLEVQKPPEPRKVIGYDLGKGVVSADAKKEKVLDTATPH